MIGTVRAKYFDGKTSVAKSTEITVDGVANQLRWVTEDKTLVDWDFHNLQFDKYGNQLEIRCKETCGVILMVEDEVFIEDFYQLMKRKKKVDIHTRLMNIGFSKIVAIALVFFALIVLSYLYLLPPIAEKSVTYIPDSFDDYIGDTFIETFFSDNNIDSLKTKYLEEFASELDLGNQKPLRFWVVESDEVNAFALPNGQIVVFTGILDKIETPEELAALLGHEASHINFRHSTKMLSRNLAGYMLVSLLLTDVNGITSVLADNVHQLHSLSYSRKFEQEADEKGLEILFNNQLNPKGMVRLFERLNEATKFSVPEIISSHPLTTERKKHMEDIISTVSYNVKPKEHLVVLFNLIKN